MKVKICGLTHPDDAEFAACAGADYIGILLSDRSKRKVGISLAKEIADAARREGAEPIGVFVDETEEQILSISQSAGICGIQLHGPISKKALPALIDHFPLIFYASTYKQTLPLTVIPLYDSPRGGSGVPFDWKAFSPPKNRHWVLAGGLTPSNVREAITLLKPKGVDVSTGVEFAGMTKKDPLLVTAFIQAAKERT